MIHLFLKTAAAIAIVAVFAAWVITDTTIQDGKEFLKRKKRKNESH